MKRIMIAAGLLAASIIFATLSAAETDLQALAAADNGFAFRLLQQLAKEQPAANVFISPYGAATVLQMAGSGAAGQTKAEMQQVLGTASLSANAVNAAAKSMGASLNHPNPNVTLVTANAIWYKRGAPAKSEFLASCRQFFDATVDPLDFGDPHSVDVINAWANEKTHGRISRIADGMIDPVYSRLFLANAVYFKGKWSDPFKPENTKDQPFHRRGGDSKMVPMMNLAKTFTYREGTGYQAVRLPYGGENLAMYVFLPATNSSPEHLLAIMSGDKWRRVTKPGFSEKEGRLVLPKFKLEYSVELQAPLKAMGMRFAFDADHANFSNLDQDPLYISGARQKTFVEVTEEGTEAAAVTAIGLPESGIISTPPPIPFEMIVDRPFMFLIEDSRTEVILFMGLVFSPQNS